MQPKIFQKIDKFLNFFEGWTLFLSVIIALAVAATNIALRKLTPHSLYWSDEVVRKTMYLTTYIGCSVAIRNRTQIRIDALTQLVPLTKWPLTVFSHLSMIFFGVLMVWLGGNLTYDMYQNPYALTISLRIPEWYFYAVLPLLGALSVLRSFMVLVADWQERRGGSS